MMLFNFLLLLFNMHTVRIFLMVLRRIMGFRLAGGPVFFVIFFGRGD